MSGYLGIESTDKKPYIFISYNTEDQERLSDIAKILKEKKINVWYDNGIEKISEEEWQEQIANHILEAEIIFFFISKGIFEKKNSFVRKEYDSAERHNKKICVVLLDDIDSANVPSKYEFWWGEILNKQSINGVKLSAKEIANEINKECLKHGVTAHSKVTYDVTLKVYSPVPVKLILEEKSKRVKLGSISDDEACHEKTFSFSVKESFDVIYTKTDKTELTRVQYDIDSMKSQTCFYNLEECLSEEQIISCCDRKAARVKLSESPTNKCATFQLGKVGTEEDLNYLLGKLDDYTLDTMGPENENIWECVNSVYKLSYQYKRPDAAQHIQNAMKPLATQLDAEKTKSLENIIKFLQELVPSKDSIYNYPNLYRIELVVHSPVAINVYLYDKNHLITRVNDGDSKDVAVNNCSLLVNNPIFDIVFEVDGFERSMTFDVKDNKEDHTQNVELLETVNQAVVLAKKQGEASFTDREKWMVAAIAVLFVFLLIASF